LCRVASGGLFDLGIRNGPSTWFVFVTLIIKMMAITIGHIGEGGALVVIVASLKAGCERTCLACGYYVTAACRPIINQSPNKVILGFNCDGTLDSFHVKAIGGKMIAPFVGVVRGAFALAR
jgi:hypothetical protein